MTFFFLVCFKYAPFTSSKRTLTLKEFLLVIVRGVFNAVLHEPQQINVNSVIIIDQIDTSSWMLARRNF